MSLQMEIILDEKKKYQGLKRPEPTAAGEQPQAQQKQNAGAAKRTRKVQKAGDPEKAAPGKCSGGPDKAAPGTGSGGPGNAAHSNGPAEPEAKLPKKVLEARQALSNEDMEITAQNLKAMLQPKDLNLLAVAFRSSMCEAAKQAYKDLPNDNQRREWLAQFVIDPLCATATGFNATEVGFTERSKRRIIWVTEEQLADLLKSEKHASIMKADMRDRPHESPSMAKAGILQFEYECTEQEYANYKKESAGTRLEAELTGKEHQRVTSDMKTVQIGTSAGIKKPVSKQPKQKVEKTQEHIDKENAAQ